MAKQVLPPHIQAMLSPDAYPHPTDAIELVQTHISYVLLTGEFVYKLKKPISLGFLDYTTLEQRRHFCEEEVRLNSRLCAETYVGVVAVVERDGTIKVDGEGDVIDYAVKMRRLPDAGMMTALLERDAVTPEMLATLAGRIADFHASSERSDEIDRFGGLETAMVNWRENFEQTEPYIGRTITRAEFNDTQAFIDAIAGADEELFAQRVREGRARDCHGDLRSDAVCYKNGDVCITDCIEFNERFRYSDVAADIAFLAMDLEFRGRRDLSDELMGRYLVRTLDGTLPLVLPFYKCYRAYVRGKVDGFQLDQPEVDETQKAAATASARSYFALASSYAAEAPAARLIITVGVTGSGKSYLANALAARMGAAIFASDVVRKWLAGTEPTDAHVVPFNAGIYDPAITDRTYEALLDEARGWLERGKPVILDASYLQRKHREAALRLTLEVGVPFLAIECEADDALVYQRLSARAGEERVVSDGRWEIYKAQQESREPIEELPIGSHLAVETAEPLRQQIAHVLEHVEGAANVTRT